MAEQDKPDPAEPANPDATEPEPDAPKADAPATEGEAAKAADPEPKPEADKPVEAAPVSVAVRLEVDSSKAAAWGRPLVRLDAKWTKFEMGLAATVLLLEILALSLWVALKGLSAPFDVTAESPNRAGLVFRALFGAALLGGILYRALKDKDAKTRSIATTVAVFIAVFGARAWANKGVDWSSNLLNWYQQSTTLTLFGGLRGVGTRLTMLLVLLGGSLATAAGKHITIDLVTRFLKPKLRLPVVLVGWVATSGICAVAAWGFFDHIAIEDFDAKAEASASEKLADVTRGMGEHFYIGRKQIGLDFKSFPHVIKGEPYANWMRGTEWNAWVDESGLADHYGKDKADALKIKPNDLHTPFIIVPGKGDPRRELIKSANLVFPIGLLIVAIRFVLLALLALSGHRSVDPEAHMDLGLKREEDASALKEAV